MQERNRRYFMLMSGTQDLSLTICQGMGKFPYFPKIAKKKLDTNLKPEDVDISSFQRLLDYGYLHHAGASWKATAVSHVRFRTTGKFWKMLLNLPITYHVDGNFGWMDRMEALVMASTTRNCMVRRSLETTEIRSMGRKVRNGRRKKMMILMEVMLGTLSYAWASISSKVFRGTLCMWWYT